VAVLLVLGAGGFIGRSVTEAARALPGLHVVGTGRGQPPPGFEVESADDWLTVDLLQDPGGLASHLRRLRPHVVVNCVGMTTGSIPQLVEANVLATARLLSNLDASGVAARLVHVGSAAEYGPGVGVEPVAESACPRPVGPYGISKLGGSQLVMAAAATGRIEATVLRVFNVLGRRMHESTLAGSVMRRLIDARARGVDEIETGPLDSVRDFVDARDMASAIVAACTVPHLDASVVNIGSGTGRTAGELVRAIALRLGFNGAIREQASGSPRSLEVPWQVADVSLARRVLAWEPIHDFWSTVEFITGEDTQP